MNLGTTRLRGRPRNRWQDEVREDGRTVGGEGWQWKVHNREEWKKLLRMARNRWILHMPMEWMNCIPLNRVDSQFPWCIRSGLNENHPVWTIKPAHLKVVFMRENICKIQIARNPVNCDATNPIRTNTILNYRLKFCAIWSNTENAIPDSSVKLNPIYPVLCIMYINV